METFRVQRINGKPELQVTETAPAVKKKVYTEEGLLRQKVYFEGMIAKGEAGLTRVNGLIQKLYE